MSTAMLECTAVEAPTKTRAEKLADAILADNERRASKNETRDPFAECFSCGRGMAYRGSRFCSDRCRDWYDAGNPWFTEQRECSTRIGQAPGQWRLIAGPPGADAPYMPKPMRAGKVGFYIDCADCAKEFESKGFRCCSVKCDRAYSERQANIATMAQVGIKPEPKRQCACCGARIPIWRKGRKVSKATRFCSAKCSRRPRHLGPMKSTSKIQK
jgi:hypothetical protein